jgi:biotin transport system substrate-specific component
MHTPSRSIALVSLFAALIAVFGLIPKIDLPLGVPITLQTLGVMLAGCLLGPKRALQALALFLAAVALGLPLLSGGRGGLGVFCFHCWFFLCFCVVCYLCVIPRTGIRIICCHIKCIQMNY